jgi:hypothetical protein
MHSLVSFTFWIFNTLHVFFSLPIRRGFLRWSSASSSFQNHIHKFVKFIHIEFIYLAAINNIMTRKNSLKEISKAYEEVLLEMNIASQPNPQNVLIKNFPEPLENQDGTVNFTAAAPLPSAEQMSDTVNRMDANKEKCSECEDGNCPPEEGEEEENCEDCYDVHDSGNMDMAKSEIYKIKKYAEDIMNLFSCSHKMEAWMLSKLVKAADYLCSVRGVLDYDKYEKSVKTPMDDFSNDMLLVQKITDMLSGEGKAVNEKVLRQIIFNLEILKESK